MTLKKYLFFMCLATGLCIIGWAEVLFYVDPQTAGWPGFGLFYGSLFLSLFGIFSIIGFIIRYLLKQGEFAYNQVKTAFRQGLLLALLLVGALYLQGEKLLVWWNLMLLVLLIAGVEFMFLGRRGEQEHSQAVSGQP